MTDKSGRGWHDDSQEHDLARQGIKTKRPGISEENAEKIVTALKGSPTKTSQARSQMTWYDELWLDGRALPDDSLDKLDIEDLQAVRKKAEEHLQQSTAAIEHKEFYQREMNRIKNKIGEKIRQRMKDLEKEMDEIK